MKIICILRNKTIKKYAIAKYNKYVIKQNKLIKSNRKEGKPFGKTEKKGTEKELLEQKRIKFQIYESVNWRIIS